MYAKVPGTVGKCQHPPLVFQRLALRGRYPWRWTGDSHPTPHPPSPPGAPPPTLRGSRLGDRKASCWLVSPSAAPPWGNGSRGGSSLGQHGVCLREEWLEETGEVSSQGPDRQAGAGISSSLGLQRHAYACASDSLNCISQGPGNMRNQSESRWLGSQGLRLPEGAGLPRCWWGWHPQQPIPVSLQSGRAASSEEEQLSPLVSEHEPRK